MNLADLLEEFNVVIDTAEGLTELRSLILGLAVRGKLVPQDPDDEPASELLKKIEEEKQRLYEEGKIRKPKKYKEIPKKDSPFEIPANWKWIKIGNSGITQTGTTPKKSEKKFWGDYCKFIKPANIESGEINYESEGVSKIAVEKGKARLIKEKSILVVCIGTLGKTGFTIIDVSCNQQINTITPYSGIDYKFLYHVLTSKIVQSQYLDRATSTTIVILNKGNWEKTLIPLPPLTEQHRIVQKIESLFAEVDKLEDILNLQGKLDEKLQLAVNSNVKQAPDAEASKSAWNFITSNFDTLYHTPEAIDNLKKNILNEAVRGRLVPQNPNDEPASELLRKIDERKEYLIDKKLLKRGRSTDQPKSIFNKDSIPSTWAFCKSDEIFFITKLAGFEYTKYINLEEEGEVPAIRAQNVKPLQLDKKNLLYIDKKTSEELDRSALTKKCLLVTFIGAGIGEVSLFNEEKRWHLAPNVAKLEPFDGCEDWLDLDYLNYFFFSELGQAELFKHLKKTAQPSLSMGTIRDIDMPIPPLEEQHRIVRRVEELFAICDRFKAQLKQHQTVNERLVKGLVGEVLGNAGSVEKEAVQVEEISMAAEPEEEYLTKQQIAFLQILCIAHALYVLKQRNMLQGEMGLAKYVYLMDRIGGVDTRFKFEQNNFGPYPSNFRRRLFTKSKYFYKSGSERYEVIDLTNKSDRLFEKESKKSKEVQNAMESLTTIFEPYQKNRAHKLELLASVCWLIEKTKQTDFDTIWKELENWETPKRNDLAYKAELFTKEEVEKSLGYIIEKKWDEKLLNADKL